MSMLPLFWPVILPALIEDAKRNESLLDKDIQIAMRFQRASDWSKAKAGPARGGRPLDLHRLVERGPKPFVINLLKRIVAGLEADEDLPTAPPNPSVRVDRDLVRDLVQKMDLVLASVEVVSRIAKADLSKKRKDVA